MQKYLDIINQLLSAENKFVQAHIVLLQLLKKYRHDAEQPTTSRHHAYRTIRLIHVLEQDYGNSKPIDFYEEIIAKQLNIIPVNEIKKGGDFHELLAAFVSIYPHFIFKLNNNLVSHLTPKRHLLDLNKVVPLLISSLNTGSFLHFFAEVYLYFRFRDHPDQIKDDFISKHYLSFIQRKKQQAVEAALMITTLAEFLPEKDTIAKALASSLIEPGMTADTAAKAFCALTQFKKGLTPETVADIILTTSEDMKHPRYKHSSYISIFWNVRIIMFLSVSYKVKLPYDVIDTIENSNYLSLLQQDNELYKQFSAYHYSGTTSERIIGLVSMIAALPDLDHGIGEKLIIFISGLNESDVGEILATTMNYLRHESSVNRIVAVYIISCHPNLFKIEEIENFYAVLERLIDEINPWPHMLNLAIDKLAHNLPDNLKMKCIERSITQHPFREGLHHFAPFDAETEKKISNAFFRYLNNPNYVMVYRKSLLDSMVDLQKHFSQNFRTKCINKLYNMMDNSDGDISISHDTFNDINFPHDTLAYANLLNSCENTMLESKIDALIKILISDESSIKHIIMANLIFVHLEKIVCEEIHGYIVESLKHYLSHLQNETVKHRLYLTLINFISDSDEETAYKNIIAETYFNKLTTEPTEANFKKMLEILPLASPKIKQELCHFTFKRFANLPDKETAYYILWEIAKSLDNNSTSTALMPYLTLFYHHSFAGKSLIKGSELAKSYVKSFSEPIFLYQLDHIVNLSNIIMDYTKPSYT